MNRGEGLRPKQKNPDTPRKDLRVSHEDRFDPPEKEEATILSRRTFLAATAGASLIGVLGLHKLATQADKTSGREVKKLRERAATPRHATFLEAKPEPRLYETSELSECDIDPSLEPVLGFHGKAGKTTAIDFKFQLAQQLKAQLAGMEQGAGAEYGQHNPGVLAALEDLYKSYTGKDRVTFDTYRNDTAATINKLRPQVPWEKLERTFALGKNQAALLKALEAQLDGDAMVAYSMTELLPGENGTQNARIMDFLLKNAGRDYIELSPAAGKELAVGPYRLSNKDLYWGLSGKDEAIQQRGATVVDRLLRRPVWPPNVATLRGESHYQTAYLLSLYHLCLLVKDIGEDRAGRAIPYLSEIAPSIADYIPVAHHGPIEARDEFVRVLREKLGEKPVMRGDVPSYGQLLRPQLQSRVHKAQNNRAALKGITKSR